MVNTFASYHLSHSHTHDLEIKLTGPALQVFVVKLHFDWNRELIASVNLGPAGKPGYKHMNTALRTQGDQIFLIEQGRTRSNEAQVSYKDAEQLRQLIEACFAKKTPNGCKEYGRIRQ